MGYIDVSPVQLFLVSFAVTMLARVARYFSSRPGVAAARNAAAVGVPRSVAVKDLLADVVEWPATVPSAEPLYFLMFPGNPGAVHFYLRFARRIHAAFGGKLHVVVLGHASHSATSTVTAGSGGGLLSWLADLLGWRMHGLQTQVQHKVDYVVEHLLARTPSARFILNGHSIGAYIALQLMRHLPQEAVLKAILLFPTLANMAQTTNGQKLMPLFLYGRPFVWLVAHVVRLLPAALRRVLVRWYMRPALAAAAEALQTPQTPAEAAAAEEEAVDAVCQLLHPAVAANALYMALTEMREVTDLDHAHMAAVQDKLLLYFSPTDHWTRNEDAHATAAAYPRATVLHCSEGHKHAFVLSPASADAMADKTVAWIAPLVAQHHGHAGAGLQQDSEAKVPVTVAEAVRPAVSASAAAAAPRSSQAKSRARSSSAARKR